MKYENLGLSNTNEMLGRALRGEYAVPAYNFSNLEQLQAILTACEQTESPVILQVSNGARKYTGKEILMAMVGAAVHGLKIPIALHLDHGADFDICKDCIDMGFSSVMIDASFKSFDENVAISKKVADYAHKYNVSVEAELGALVGIEDELKVEKSCYTNPDDVVRFVEQTGVDSLAISIGTSHGAYKMKSPDDKLRFDILEKVQEQLPEFPLVLHGASSVPQNLITEINEFGGKIAGARGIPEDQLITARKMNICKINVDSDARLAFTAGIRESLTKNPENFDPRTYLSVARDKMIQLYKDKNVNIMGSAGKI